MKFGVKEGQNSNVPRGHILPSPQRAWLIVPNCRGVVLITGVTVAWHELAFFFFNIPLIERRKGRGMPACPRSGRPSPSLSLCPLCTHTPVCVCVMSNVQISSAQPVKKGKRAPGFTFRGKMLLQQSDATLFGSLFDMFRQRVQVTIAKKKKTDAAISGNERLIY